LAAKAAESPDLLKFGDLNKMLAGQAQQVMGKVQKELGHQIEGITKNVTGELNKTLGGTGIDVNKTIGGATGGTDPSKAATDGLGGLLGGDKKEKEKEKKKAPK